MFRRLPRWVEVGAFWLAAIAGSVNAIGLLGFKHQAVSHLTGTSTLLGVSVIDGDIGAGMHLLLILLAFVLGAALSGVLIENEALRLGRRYSAALALEAALLVLAMACLWAGSTSGHFFASAACGLQNGMVSTYSGAAIRTTHVSGLFTDLGTMLGHRLRGQAFDARKALLYALVIAGFIAGGSVGAAAFRDFGFGAMLLPAGAALLLALAYEAFRAAGATE